jgi:hypothetical protein
MFEGLEYIWFGLVWFGSRRWSLAPWWGNKRGVVVWWRSVSGRAREGIGRACHRGRSMTHFEEEVGEAGWSSN